MSDTKNPDSSNLEALRRDLQEMRNKARDEGILSAEAVAPMALGGGGVASAGRQAIMSAVDPNDKGKQAATRLMAILRRTETDTSAIVPGTDFTEQGIARMQDLLTASVQKQGTGDNIYVRLQKFLASPAQNGGRVICGIGTEKIRILSHLLEQTEKLGWEQVKAQLAQRAQAASKAADIAKGTTGRRAIS
jgi:glycosyltransferase A (GT-A) superfamily protein (DUF2064 family)